MSFIQNQSRIRYEFESDTIKDDKWAKCRILLCDRATKGVVIFAIFAIVLPILVYFVVIDRGTYKIIEAYSCLVNETYKVPCGRSNLTSKDCEQIYCCYDSKINACYHYLPSKYYYEKNAQIYEPSKNETPFRNPSENVALAIQEHDENRVSIILHDPKIEFKSKRIEEKKQYNISENENGLAIEIFRANNDDILLTTCKGPLIVSNGYWEWSIHLTDEYLFGLGETLIRVDDGKSNLTKVIYRNGYDHNTLPIFMAYKRNSFHGLIVRHVGPMEVTILPSNLILLKVLAGNYLKLELSLGPTPKDVLNQQRTDVNDFNLYDDWVYGTHICRIGPSSNINEILDEFEGFLKYDFPSNADCIHENLWFTMLTMTDTEIVRLTANLKKLKNSGRKFILALPPHIPFELKTNISNVEFYKNHQGEVYYGTYLNTKVIYPDYSQEDVKNYIVFIRDFLKNKLGFDSLPDGLMLVNNWPSDESFKMKNESYFPYISENLLTSMSNNLPWNTTTDNQSFHMTKHNSYGYNQLMKMKTNMSEFNDLFIMSASNDFDSFHPHLIQNVNISWTNLKKTIRTILYNSLFSSRLISVPVCGSSKFYDTENQESLCIRWYLMAATMPLFLISSDHPRRDPTSLNSAYAANVTKFAIETRNSLLPYFKTIIYNNKEPLVRPMFYDFYDDKNTFPLDEQYMIGNQLLIAQPVLPNTNNIQVYLPPAIKVWYEFWGGNKYEANGTNSWISLDIVETDWISFIAHGSIIPLIKNVNGLKTIELIVAHNCTSICEANGHLLVGDSMLMFTSTENGVSLMGLNEEFKKNVGCPAVFVLKTVHVFNETTQQYNINKNLCEMATDSFSYDFKNLNYY